MLEQSEQTKFDLGMAHIEQIEHTKAFDCFLSAAGQGHANSQVALGRMYEIGQAVEQNYEKAIYWWAQAAEQNNPLAKMKLCLIYHPEQGALKDETKFTYWLAEVAAESKSIGDIKIDFADFIFGRNAGFNAALAAVKKAFKKMGITLLPF